MKCVNQRFAEISIPDTVDEVPNYMDLASLPAYFNDLSNSTKSVPTGIREGCYILDNELVLVAANELVCLPSGRDVAHVRDLESDDDEEYKDKDDGFLYITYSEVKDETLVCCTYIVFIINSKCWQFFAW